MKDYYLSKATLAKFMDDIQIELDESPSIIVSTQHPGTGKCGMARLWRQWMSTTANRMVANGCIMPLMLNSSDDTYGIRPFNASDAHELFTYRWLGVDTDGERLCWSKRGSDGRRSASKGERFHAMLQHEEWCTEKGIILLKPRDSEYSKLDKEQNG